MNLRHARSLDTSRSLAISASIVRIQFTDNLSPHLPGDLIQVFGATLIEALHQAFDKRPLLRGYLLDDAGALRKPMNIFIDGNSLGDRTHLSDAINPDADIWVFQALSGG